MIQLPGQKILYINNGKYYFIRTAVNGVVCTIQLQFVRNNMRYKCTVT